MSGWPAGQKTVKSTLPYGVPYGPNSPLVFANLTEVTFSGAAGAGSSLPAARPGGYRDGAEDAMTMPSAPTATIAVTAWSPRIGPVIAGTASVPSGVRRGLALAGRLAGVAEYRSFRHDAVGIALVELLAVALGEGVHLSLQLGAVHQREYLEAEHERLDQHHDGERDENVGGDQPA